MSSIDDRTIARALVPLGADWGVMRVAGSDAATFLQGQLTNDVASLDARRATLAGYCSAKGRLLATFVVWRPASDEFLLACDADVLAAVAKRLSMFVLRSKCKVSDAGLALVGAIGDAVPEHVRAASAMDVVDGWVRLPDVDGSARAWCVSSPTEPAPASSTGGDDPAAAQDACARDAWRWLEVRSGWPRITTATADAFVPQMVNLELVRGVSFGKGCYPGQEVVARSQYRGTLKRRMHLFAGGASAKPGDDVFHDADPSQPSGTVVDAASRGGAHVTLVSLKTALFDNPGSWHLRSVDGPVLEHQPMPYDVPREAEIT